MQKIKYKFRLLGLVSSYQENAGKKGLIIFSSYLFVSVFVLSITAIGKEKVIKKKKYSKCDFSFLPECKRSKQEDKTRLDSFLDDGSASGKSV